MVWKALANKGTNFLRGQLGLTAAGPGTGKSGFALTLALVLAREHGIPSLYLSADSDAFVQLQRSISILCKCSLAEAAEMILSDNLARVIPTLRGLPIRFTYHASPSLDDIERSIESYDEVYGDYPALVTVDNVTNVRSEMSSEEGDPFAGLEGLMDYLHGMARETEAVVHGLHHVTSGFNDADKPIPLSGVKGQITRVPELVLTLHKRAGDDWTPDVLGVSTVKNRGGKADPSGQDFVELAFDGPRMAITDPDRKEMTLASTQEVWGHSRDLVQGGGSDNPFA